jgi:hypothetical protein
MWDRAFDLMRAHGLTVEPALTTEELSSAEERFAVRFPAGLAELLGQGLPSGKGFPRWRSLEASVESQLAWPLERILFDVEQSAFWMPEWRERPTRLDAAKAVADAAVRAAPVLRPHSGRRGTSGRSGFTTCGTPM